MSLVSSRGRLGSSAVMHWTSVTSIAGMSSLLHHTRLLPQTSMHNLLVLLSCSNDQIGVQNTIGAINAVTIFLGALYSLNVSRHRAGLWLPVISGRGMTASCQQLPASCTPCLPLPTGAAALHVCKADPMAVPVRGTKWTCGLCLCVEPSGPVGCACAWNQVDLWAVPVLHQEGPLAALPCNSVMLTLCNTLVFFGSC